MDWLTFFSTNIKSLAWPAVAVTIVFILKRQIGDLIHTLGVRLEKVTVGGQELVFGKAVDEIEATLAGKVKEPATPIETISELSQLPPPYIVSQAWLKLEQALREAASPFISYSNQVPHNIVQYIKTARRQELLSAEEIEAVLEMKTLRDQVTHFGAPEITVTDALRYQDIANSVIEKLKGP